jgi:hypothetical protein
MAGAVFSFAMRAPILALLICGCGGHATQADPGFLVSVGNEHFVVQIADPAQAALARGQIGAPQTLHPAGKVLAGNGGFNSPWHFHLRAETVRMVELSMEVCDGRPSYVDAHLDQYPTYCPWNGRIVGELP